MSTSLLCLVVVSAVLAAVGRPLLARQPATVPAASHRGWWSMEWVRQPSPGPRHLARPRTQAGEAPAREPVVAPEGQPRAEPEVPAPAPAPVPVAGLRSARRPVRAGALLAALVVSIGAAVAVAIGLAVIALLVVLRTAIG